MPKISDKKREDRRQQILGAALACFSEDGFHQTGMANIVKRSGLSHGAVYLYFRSKDDLIEALADDRHRREGVLNSAAQGSGDPIAGLHALVRAYAQWLTNPAGEARRRVGIHGWAEALRNCRVRTNVVEAIDMPRALIVALVERGQHHGLVKRDLGADAIARVLIAIFQGLVLQKCWGEDFDAEACMVAVESVIDGFRTPKPDVRRRTRA
jgi:AcrR family transcriptional regulator